MNLSDFRLDTVTVQLQYENAFLLWDRAGSIALALSEIWPGLKLIETGPNQQTYRSRDVTLVTGIKVCNVTLTFLKSGLDKTITQRLKETFEVWRKELALETVARLSTRAIYVREFATLQEANEALINLQIVKWPSINVFDQPESGELNGPELLFKFEDKESFTFLRLKAEQLKYEVTLERPFEDQDLKKISNRLVVDFDRGLLGSVKITSFRMEDWLKGVQHVLSRDFPKVVP